MVEVPVLEHNKSELKEAKVKEIQNLEYYETFEWVEDVGQEPIGKCWVITWKESTTDRKHNSKQDLR